jgi:hypothetical protein
VGCEKKKGVQTAHRAFVKKALMERKRVFVG